MKFDNLELVNEVAPVDGYDAGQAAVGTTITSDTTTLQKTFSIGGTLTAGRLSAWRCNVNMDIRKIRFQVGVAHQGGAMNLEVRVNKNPINTGQIALPGGVGLTVIYFNDLSNNLLVPGDVLSFHVSQVEATLPAYHLTTQVEYRT